jgi:chemotaxis protein MotB
MADDKPIIVVKKKGGHGGHHGGAWKIAYADFVTAMMAFFMVMWLVNSASSPTKESIASYFRKPGLFTEGSGTPLLIGGAGILPDAFVPPRPEDKKRRIAHGIDQNPKPLISGESEKDLDRRYIQEGLEEPVKSVGPDKKLGLNSELAENRDISNEVNIVRPSDIKKFAETAVKQLKEMIEREPQISELLGQLEFKIEADGLKIEIMDTDKVSMFDSGSSRIRKEAEIAFQKVASIIQKFPNTLEVTGHTDAKPFPSRTGGYTNWELSADRANSARRLLEIQGIAKDQIGSVVGRAATDPKTPEDPLDARNRRITLKMKFDGKQVVERSANDTLNDLLGPPPVKGEATPMPTATPTPTETPTPPPVPGSPTARPTATPRGDRIRLPDGPAIKENPEYMPQDKIFNNNPVIGPAELFSGR